MDVTDGSLPHAHSLPLISSPNRRGHRFVPRAWTPRHWTTFRLPRAAPLPPSLSNPARFFLLDDADMRATLSTPSLSHRTMPTPSVPSHLRREPRNTAATAISARELLSGEISRHRPPPPDPPHPEAPDDATRPPRVDPRHARSSSDPDDDLLRRAIDVTVDKMTRSTPSPRQSVVSLPTSPVTRTAFNSTV